MNLEMLRDYNEWLKKSPADVLAAVKPFGWAIVFDKGIPRWAHRVRNFFNQEPRFLMLLDKDHGNEIVRSLYQTIKPPNESSSQNFFRRMALTGDAYRDENNKIWLQMSPAGAIYHFAGIYGETKFQAAYQQINGQRTTPVFKLISSDATGGSRETIIVNQMRGFLKRGDYSIGHVHAYTPVSRLVVTDGYQGSYNYAETVKKGLPAHEKFDVNTHKKDADYVNPKETEGRFLPLSSRKFPKYDNKGKLLAEQNETL